MYSLRLSRASAMLGGSRLGASLAPSHAGRQAAGDCPHSASPCQRASARASRSLLPIGAGLGLSARGALLLATIITLAVAPIASAITRTWDGGAGTLSWHDANNWDPDGVPGPADDVLIDVPAPTIAITYSTGTSTINSLTSQENLTLSGGTLNISAASAINAAFTLSGGTLGGSGTVTITGAVSWTAGAMSGSGQTIIEAGGSLSLSGGLKHLSRTLVNDGTATWSSGDWLFANGTYTSNGPFTASTTVPLTAAGDVGTSVFNSNGTFTKEGTGTVTFLPNPNVMAFNNAGSVNVNAGTLQLNSGASNAGQMSAGGGNISITPSGAFTNTGTVNIAATRTVTITSGTFSNSGTGLVKGNGTLIVSGATLSNAATFAPGASPGTLTVTGNYPQTAAGTLDIELGGLAPGSQHDHLAVSGTATLSGTLRLSFVKGFVPHPGDSFTILTSGTRSGTFSTVDVIGYPDCVAGVTYNPTSVVVTIDSTPPTAVCQDIKVDLDGSGNASITAAQVDDGSSDNCEMTLLEVAPSSFTCANLGTNKVTLTVTDITGNASTCQATVTVNDVTPPTITCQDVTISLDEMGNAVITPAQVFASGSDNCTINLVSVVPDTFSCANLGPNLVTLTVNDGNGNEATCQATVTVEDVTPRTLTCQDITISLDESGNATITPAQVFASGFDACGTVNLVSVVPDTFTCANLGPNLVTLTANDGNGNEGTCEATVTVEDTTPPAVSCQKFEVMLNGLGQATITPQDVFATGTDNCATVNLLSVKPDSFSCGNVGPNTVTLTVDDGHGNESTCEATVTVLSTGQYLGAPGGSWFAVRNWCSGLPDQSDNVSLDTTVLVDQLGAEAQSVHVLAGGDLRVGAPGGASINVAQDLTVDAGGSLTILGEGTVQALNIVIHSGGALHVTSATAMLVATNLTIEEGATLDWTAGTIMIDGGTWTNPLATTLSVGCAGAPAALVVVNGGTVHADQIDLCVDGEARGNGMLVAAVDNQGTVRPGLSAGILVINGTYGATGTGTTEIEIGGLVPGLDHDVLSVSGAGIMGGLLRVLLIGGFTPALGDEFTIVNAGTVVGEFSTFDLPALGGGVEWVVVTESTTVLLRVQAGSPFEPPQETPAAGEPVTNTVGDLDGEGTVDTAVVIPGPPLEAGHVQVFRNLGNDVLGEWQGLAANPPIQVGNAPSGVVTSLFNNDPHMDLAVTNAGDDNVHVLLNQGLGDASFALFSIVPVGNAPSAITAADYNEDLVVDLAVTNKDDGTVLILVGDGFGNFAPAAAAAPIVVGALPVAMSSGDFDGNKCPDLGGASQGTVAGPGSGTVFVLLGQLGGGFLGPFFYDIGLEPTDVATGDLDLDGSNDIVAANGGDNTLSILLNLGNGSFAPVLTVPVGTHPLSVDVFDLENDGDLDVAVVAEVDGTRLVQVLENLIDGGTVPVFAEPFAVGVSANANFVVQADFNVDSFADLVTVNADTGPTGGSVTVLLSNPPCPADCGDQDGLVGVVDFLALLAEWGQAGTPCDVDGGVVGVTDFLDLLAHWGPCP